MNGTASGDCSANPTLTLNVVVQANHSIGIFFRGEQVQKDIAVPRRDQTDAFTDKHRDNVNVEFVDLARVEERGDQLSSAHHPDMFAGTGTQVLRKRFYGLRHKLYVGRRISGRPT